MLVERRCLPHSIAPTTSVIPFKLAALGVPVSHLTEPHFPHNPLHRAWKYEPHSRYSDTYFEDSERDWRRGSREQVNLGPCSSVRHQPTDEAQLSMSYPLQSEERLSNILPRNYGGPTASVGSSAETSTSRQGSISSQRDVRLRNTPALPSLATLTGEVDLPRDQGRTGSPTPWRSLGVRNILNPASEVQTPSQSQPTPHSPPAAALTGYQGPHAAPRTSPHVRKRGQPHSPVVEPHSQQSERPDRRVLTPRSPSLRAVRAASAGGYRSPSTGGGHVQRIPLPSGEGRGYTIEPGDSRDAAIPPLPPLSTAARIAPPGLPPTGSRSPATHGTGINTTHQAPAPLLKQQEHRSELGRPPYPGETGPPAFPPTQAQMHLPLTMTGSDNHTGYATSTSGPVRSGLPYGQAEYQLTFETQQGPMVVPVNVDYQQASRLADEKRKRNAGASARFRQRRKEKEREANQAIAGLQQEMQDLAQEREFYLRERNFFRDMLARTHPGPLPVRPHSPQTRRTHTGTSPASETSPRLDYSRHETEMQANQRRRTGEYQSSLTSQSPTSTYTSSFPPPGQSLNLPAPSIPSAYSESRTRPPGPSPSTSRAPMFDPLRRNVLDRDWSAGR